MDLLIVEESDVVRKVAKRILTGLNFQVMESASVNDAMVKCTKGLPPVMIIDAGMESALELISFVRSLPGNDKTRIYYCIVEADLKKMMAGRRAGANDFLMKPFDRKTLSSVFLGMAKAA